MHHQVSPCPSPSLRTRHSHPEEPLVIDNWKKEKTLGSGAFGIITLWKNLRTNEYIAIKQCRYCLTPGIPNGPLLISKQQRERWVHEVDLMKRLNHPNVVKAVPVPPCLEPRVPQPLPSLGMEYCSGGDLRGVLNKPEHCCGLAEWSVRLILSQISSALLYLHSERIIHRDVKPENIVLKLEPNGTVTYKIIDLGYCKELDQNSMASSFVGTMQYLAPELFENKQYTAAVDNWSFGLLAHEIITGERPFAPNSTPAQWLPIVRDKKPEAIGATLDTVTGNVTYHKTISSFNHVCAVFKSDLENWLRIVLQKDPEKRGGKEAFQMILSSILNKQIIKVFSVPNLQLYTYELSESMKIQELKVLIESNTQFVAKDQILLVPSCPGVRPRSILIAGDALDDQMVAQCVTMKGRNDSHVDIEGDTLYLFHRSHPLSFTQYSVTSLIPPSEESVLLNPTNLVTFQDHKSTAGNFVWVAQELILKYNRLTGAHQALIYYCLQLFQNVKTKEALALQTVSKVSLTMDLLQQQVATCINNIKTLRPSKVDSILNNFETTLDKFKEVIEVKSSLEKLSTRLNDQSSLLFNLTTKSTTGNVFDPFTQKQHKEHDQLHLIYTSIVQAYEDIRHMTRDERVAKTKLANSQAAFDNTHLVKLICDLFQLSEKLVKSSYGEMTKMLELSATFNSISKELRKVCQEAESHLTALKQTHNSLLNAQWSLISVENEISNDSSSRHPSIDCNSSTSWLSNLSQIEERLSKLLLQSTINSSSTTNTALLSTNLTDLNATHSIQ